MKKSIPMKIFMTVAYFFCSPSFESEAQVTASKPETHHVAYSLSMAQQEFQSKSLQTALLELQKEFGVYLNYEAGIVKNKLVDLQLLSASPRFATIEEALQALLAPHKLAFEKIKNNYYVIYLPGSKKAPKKSSDKGSGVLNNKVTETESLQVSGPEQMQAADISISGKVAARETGEGLPGVNIIIKGTGMGTTTDAEGRFAMAVPDETVVLVFSFIGYQSKEVAVGNLRVINVELETDMKALDEVVVVGYGSQLKRDITGSISSVASEVIQNQRVAGLDQAIQGVVPGVQVVQTSGAPGGGVSVRVRGLGTIGNTEPLYVVDGYPFNNTSNGRLQGTSGPQTPNPLNSINPNDIESIEILKDASATAIYGSRGANGVVLITTKRGKSGKAQLALDISAGWQQVIKKVDVLNAEEFVSFYNETRENGWNDRVDLRGNRTPEQYLATPNAQRGVYSVPDMLLDPSSFGAGTDWQNEVFRTAPMQNYQLRFSGGNENIQYSISGGHMNQDGVIISSGFKRYSFRTNIDAKLNSRLKAGISLSPSYTVNDVARATGHFNNGGIINQALLAVPVYPVYEEDGSYSSQLGKNGFGVVDNPVANALERDILTKQARLITNAYFDLELTKNLVFRTTFGVDYNAFRSNTFNGSKLAAAATPPPTIPSANSNAAEEFSWLNENTLSYTLRLGEQHSLSAVAGFSAQKGSFERTFVNAINLPGDQIRYVSAGIVNNGTALEERWTLLSLLSRVNYSFADKYLLTATFRSDGSSRFGSNNRWGNFPSLALGWRISEEGFMKGISVINDAKLRASYGVAGNNEIGNYSAITILERVRYNLANNGREYLGFAPSNLGDPNLTWETSEKLNLGADISLFNNRIAFTTDVYRNITRDMLLFVAVPQTSGFSSVLTNIGKIQNQGIELGLNTVNIDKKFKWVSHLNFSVNRNEVLALGTEGERIFGNGEVATETHVTMVGQPLGQFYGFIADGVFKTDEEAQNYTNADGKIYQPLARGGDLKFVDYNGDGQITPADRTIIGNPHPDFIYGITNTFSYRGFDLSMLINGVQGNDVTNLASRFATNLAGNLNQMGIVRDRWVSPEQPGNGQIPRAILNGRNDNGRLSTRFIEDGSYLRIRNITFGYNLPQAIIQRAGLQNARLYFSGQNLYTFTRYTLYDPEATDNGGSAIAPGVDSGGYPLPRVYTFGLTATF